MCTEKESPIGRTVQFRSTDIDNKDRQLCTQSCTRLQTASPYKCWHLICPRPTLWLVIILMRSYHPSGFPPEFLECSNLSQRSQILSDFLEFQFLESTPQQNAQFERLCL